MGVRSGFQSWLAKTHRPQFELVRHFLAGQLTNDLVASDQVRRLAITVLAALGCIGPLIVRLYRPKYAYLQSLDNGDLYLAAVRADRLFFISLSMIVGGFATVLQWQDLFPTRQDYLALKPLPVRMYQVFVARFLSSFLVIAVVIADLNFAASLLFPLLTSGKWQSPTFGVRYVLAHAVVTLGAALFTFFAIGGAQGLLMNILPPRMFERFSVPIQAGLAMAFLAAIPYALDIPNWHAAVAERPHWMSLFPPAWFLGLYETLLGSRETYLLQLRETAVRGATTVLFLALATYFLSYRRHAIRVQEQSPPKSSGPSLIERSAAVLLGKLVAPIPEQGTFVFAVQTIRRSRRHKFVIGFGFALALVLALTPLIPTFAHLHYRDSWSALEMESILAVPLVIGAVLISTLCYAFQLPAEPQSAWIFRMAGATARRDLLASVDSLLIVCGLAASLLVAVPIEVFTLGWMMAFAHSVLTFVLLLFLVEARLADWHKVPFTCTYLPGRRNFWRTMGIYLFLLMIVIPAVTFVEARLRRPLVLMGATIALGAVCFSLRTRRQAHWAAAPLLFDESDEPLVVGVRLTPE